MGCPFDAPRGKAPRPVHNPCLDRICLASARERFCSLHLGLPLSPHGAGAAPCREHADWVECELDDLKPHKWGSWYFQSVHEIQTKPVTTGPLLLCELTHPLRPGNEGSSPVEKALFHAPLAFSSAAKGLHYPLALGKCRSHGSAPPPKTGGSPVGFPSRSEFCSPPTHLTPVFGVRFRSEAWFPCSDF